MSKPQSFLCIPPKTGQGVWLLLASQLGKLSDPLRESSIDKGLQPPPSLPCRSLVAVRNRTPREEALFAGLELLRKASQAPDPAPLLAGALALLRDATGPAAQARDLL